MGPKGMRKKTLEKVQAARKELSHSRPTSSHPSGAPSQSPEVGHEQPRPSREYGSIAADVLCLYLGIYHHKMYPVWPIVNAAALIARLEAGEADVEAYLLATSVCAATILQLQLATEGVGMPSPSDMVDEIDSIRNIKKYRNHPTVDTISTSFFMHIAHLHLGQQMASTLLLREAISMAHLLQLQNPDHYLHLPYEQSQEELRKVWLLWITESAHSSQYDIPSTLEVPSALPPLDTAGQPYTLTAFVSLCNMFARFHRAKCSPQHTASSLISIDSELQQTPLLTSRDNALQRADVGVTQQWLRLSLWKMAVSNIRMVADASTGVESVLFPITIARELLSTMSALSQDAFEAHGPGMELKLFAFATSVADVLTCLPLHLVETSNLNPRECLAHISGVLGGFRGGSGALLSILQARLAEVGLDVPTIPRLIEISDGSNDSAGTHGILETDEDSSPGIEETGIESIWPMYGPTPSTDADGLWSSAEFSAPHSDLLT